MKLKNLIIEENENFIAVNKPQGIVVNKSETAKGETLQDLVDQSQKEYLSFFKKVLSLAEKGNLEGFDISEVKDVLLGLKEDYPNVVLPAGKNLPEIEVQLLDEFISRAGIVHRLDKDTSGILLIAKTPWSFFNLKTQFMSREVEKNYYLVCFGDIKPLFDNKDHLIVNLPLDRNPNNRRKFAVVRGGREASSYVHMVNPESQIPTAQNGDTSVTEYEGKTFSFLKVVPKTGRTHQIRVHMKALNHEILGDVLYCGRKQLEFSKKHDISLMLHAYGLKFKVFGKEFYLKADFPDKFKDTVEKLWGVESE